VAYFGEPNQYGTKADPMVGKKIGGVNVFGGGLALYSRDTGALLGGLGVSGDTSCTDHVVAWRTRFGLLLDQVPGGVSATGDDNLIIRNNPKPNTFEHPDCGGGVKQIIQDLPDDIPIGG
jgi:Haem-degrading